MENWTATVEIGKSSATVNGGAMMSVADVIAGALGVGAIELSSVLYSPETHEHLVGFRVTGAATIMMARIVSDPALTPGT